MEAINSSETWNCCHFVTVQYSRDKKTKKKNKQKNKNGTPWRSHASRMDKTVTTPSAKKRATHSISLLPAHDDFPCRRRRWTQGHLLLCPMGSWNGHLQCPGFRMLAGNGLMDPAPIMQRTQTLRQLFRLCNVIRQDECEESMVLWRCCSDIWMRRHIGEESQFFGLIEDGIRNKTVSNAGLLWIL
jgi:hypothetical protein